MMANTSIESRDSLVHKGIMCRLCMNYHEDSFNIFVSNAKCGMELWNVIRDLLSIEVAEDDGLPDTVCRLCLRKLMAFSEFKVMCLKSATQLRRNTVENCLKTEVNAEVIPNEPLVEVETYRGEHLSLESQERAVHNVGHEPLEMENVINVKEEAAPSESEEAIYEGENLGEDKSREGTVYNMVYVPLEMGNQNDAKEEVNPFESLVEVDTYHEGENFDEDDSREKPVVDAKGLPPSMKNLTDVKEEVDQSESEAEEVTYGGESFSEDEYFDRAAYKVVCVPLDMENQMDSEEGVDQSASVVEGKTKNGENLAVEGSPTGAVYNKVYDSSINRSNPKERERILSNLAVKRQGNTAIMVRRKSSCSLNPYGHFSKNDSSEQWQPTGSIEAVPRDNFYTKTFAVGSNICDGRNTNESRYEAQHLEVQKNHPCYWREYICDDCGFKCSNKTELCAHITSHILNRTLTSQRREEGISEKGILLKYNRPFQCETCGKVFGRKSRLTRHLVTHTNLKPFKCETCGLEFKWKSALVRHSIMHNGTKQLFDCETCGKVFYLKCNLMRHLVIHNGLKPFKCETCGKGFNRKCILSRHSLSHTSSKPFKCETCGKGFTQKSSLLSHKPFHTGLWSFICETCGKGFLRKSDLSKHSVIHTDLKPFKCETCGRGFNRSSHLFRHSRIHTEAIPL